MIAERVQLGNITYPCVFKDSDAEVYLEDHVIGIMLHCYVHNWNLGVYKKLLDTLTDIMSCTDELFAHSNNDRLTKFASMFGFESIDDTYDREGNKTGELLCLTL